MTISFSDYEKQIIESIKNTSMDLNQNGSTGGYMSNVVPVPNFQSVISSSQALVEDGIRSSAATIVKYVHPIHLTTYVVGFSPIKNFIPGFEIELTKVVIPSEKVPTVDRHGTIIFNTNAFSSSSSGKVEYWVKIGNQISTKCFFAFSSHSVNSSFGSTFLMNVPAGTIEVQLMAKSLSGTTTWGSDNSATLSLVI